MSRKMSHGPHLHEKILLAFCKDQLLDPERVEIHLLTCPRCLNRAESLTALILALDGESSSSENPKVMRAGS